MRTRTPSIRQLAEVAYERGEEFDPGDPEMLSPALARRLNGTITTGVMVFGPSMTERHGELLAELAG